MGGVVWGFGGLGEGDGEEEVALEVDYRGCCRVGDCFGEVEERRRGWECGGRGDCGGRRVGHCRESIELGIQRNEMNAGEEEE